MRKRKLEKEGRARKVLGVCVGGEGEEVREEKGMRESERKVSSCRLDQRGTDFINGPHRSGCNQTLISILRASRLAVGGTGSGEAGWASTISMPLGREGASGVGSSSYRAGQGMEGDQP